VGGGAGLAGECVFVLAVVDDDERFLIGEEVLSDLDNVVLAPLRLGEPFLACCEATSKPTRLAEISPQRSAVRAIPSR